MKIAITGKGGVGKTTLSAVLARLYAAEGRDTLAVDVDPDANLGLALGFAPERVNDLTPVCKMTEFIAERTASNKDNYGKFFRINPKVDDIPEKFSIVHEGVRLLVMGTVDVGGGGCVCPEHVILRRLLAHLIVGPDDVVIMDMEAGLEHLGRGTAGEMDSFIVVVEPGGRSVQTYHRVVQLAADLGIHSVYVVANKLRNEADEAFIRAQVPAEALLGMIHISADTAEADREGISPYDAGGTVVEEIKAIKERIDAMRQATEGTNHA